MTYFSIQSSVGDRASGIHLNTALARTCFGDVGQLDVALVAPGRAPRVLDEVVVYTRLCAIADSENTVVKVGSTGVKGRGVVIYTLGVELESKSCTVNGDGSWALLDGSHECALGVRRDFDRFGGG